MLAGLKVLVTEELSGAPVVSKDHHVIGMVTEFDLLLAIDCVGNDFPISRVMHKDIGSTTRKAIGLETLLPSTDGTAIAAQCPRHLG